MRLPKFFLTLLLTIPYASCISCSLDTLPHIQEYSHSYPENVRSDTTNWIEPIFDTFHRNNLPDMLSTVWYWLGIKKKHWDSTSFKQTLEEVVHIRQAQKLNDRLVAHLQCKDDDKIIVIGDLYGAFHSLTQILTWLKAQDIIDDTLRITQPGYYLVFNGNQINRSAYTLETLQVIINLILRNPEKVIYLRGQQETNNYWRNFTLKHELTIRASSVSSETTPLKTLLSSFFDTLPLALFVSVDQQPQKVICLDPQQLYPKTMSPQFLGNLFLNTPVNTLVYHPLDKHLPTAGTPVDIRALITSRDWIEGNRATKGLGLIDQEQGGTTWALFSSPLLVHQTALNFFHDAFVIITLHKPLEKSTITLYNQLISMRKGFAIDGIFNLVSSAPEGTKAFTAPLNSDFFIGSTMSLERGVPLMGRHIKSGLLVRLNQENKEGGLDGHLLRAIIYNDDYTPALARTNIHTLADTLKIPTILLPVGSPTLDAYLDYVKEKKVFVFFPVTGSPSFRTAELPAIINLRASYTDEVHALIDYMLSEYNVRKFAFFYQDDAYGQGPLATAHELLKKKGITAWTDVPYTRGLYDFSEQAKVIHTQQPEAIGFFATAQAAQNLILALGVEGIASKQMFGISFLGTETFRRFIRENNIAVVFGAVVPNPFASELPIVKEYRAAMADSHLPYSDIFSLEAYIAASLFIEVTRKLQQPFTPEKIMHALEQIKNYDFKGIQLNFNPKNRSLAQHVWVEGTTNTEWVSKKVEQ